MTVLTYATRDSCVKPKKSMAPIASGDDHSIQQHQAWLISDASEAYQELGLPPSEDGLSLI